MSRTRIILASAVMVSLMALNLGPARAQEEHAALALAARDQAGGQTVAAVGDPAAVLAGFFSALDQGDVAGMMATFTDDAVLAGFGLCRVTPCSDLEAIRWEGRRLAGEETRTVPLEATQVSAHRFTTRIGLWSKSVRAAGLERLIVAVGGDVRRDQITSLRLVPDLGDEQTASFYSWPPILPVLSATQEGDRTAIAVHAVNRTTEGAQVEVRLLLWGATVVESFAGQIGHNPPTVTGLADGGLEVGWATDTHDLPAARQSGFFVAEVSSGGTPITARVIMNFWGRNFSGSFVTPDLVTQ